MKRVYCLYRVSTIGQVDKNDIPMQRQACHTFAKEKGWRIIEEFSEKGVSGYKKSAEQREALQELKQAALQKRFDVLLVFMFDRLGRRDDETPFVVEWFVKNGIEVWSVAEGEQRFEDHIDKLLNYIRFWQSSGESLKTSIRTKARMEQLFREHGFVGGTAPYGYQLCRLGRTNKRGHELYDLTIDPTASQVIKEIFHLYCTEQEGTHRIAVRLNSAGCRTKQGAMWNSASVRSVLQNPIYTGVRQYGDAQTDRFAHLQIIEDKLFLLAQKRLEKSKLESPNIGYTKHRDVVLLSEQVFCMHCGKRLTVTLNKKTRTRKDGSTVTYERLKYICINKSSLHPCEGQRSYTASRIDASVLKLLQSVLFSDNPFLPELDISSAVSQREDLQRAIEQERISLNTLKAEVPQVLQGTSAFGSVLISELIQQSESRLIAFEQELVSVRENLRRQKSQQARFFELRKALVSSGTKDLSSLLFHQQQEIAHAMISRIELGRKGAIKIEWSFGGIAHLGVDTGD